MDKSGSGKSFADEINKVSLSHQQGLEVPRFDDVLTQNGSKWLVCHGSSLVFSLYEWPMVGISRCQPYGASLPKQMASYENGSIKPGYVWNPYTQGSRGVQIP